MLNTEIREAVDQHWNACWPTNKLSPLIIVDLVTYLYNIKQLELQENNRDERLDQTIFSEQEEELRWKSFSQLDADRMQKVFVKEGGVIDWVDRYAAGNYQFSQLLRTPLLMVPTPKLLAHAVGIVMLMNEHERSVQHSIYTYLIQKLSTVDNRLINIPEELSLLMASLLNPKDDDIILDPLAGTGNSLIQSSKHFQSIAVDSIQKNIVGFEPDPVLYRIAALNLFLTGDKNVTLTTSTDYKNVELKPTSALGNLLFSSVPIDGSNGALTVEHLFNFIEESLHSGGRAAILLTNAQNAIHKTLIEKHTLEAVISLPKELLKSSDQTNANLLVFTKAFRQDHPSIWFYDADVADLRVNEFGTGQLSAFNLLLNQWQNLEYQRTLEPTQKSFFVPAAQIRKYNYDLNIARYQYAFEKSKEEKQKATIKKNSGIVVIPPAKPAHVTQPQASIIQRPVTPRQYPDLNQPPVKRKSYHTAIVSLVVVFVLGAAGLYYFASSSTLGNKHEVPGETMVRKINVEEPVLKKQPQATTKEAIDAESNTRKTDHQKSFSKKVAGQSSSTLQTESKKSGQKEKAFAKASIKFTAQEDPVALQVNASEKETKGLYKIIDKAYFHNDPDESTRREAFVIHWNNSYATIKALEEKNDFIYTIFKNHLGQTSKGWLRKKDLRPAGE